MERPADVQAKRAAMVETLEPRILGSGAEVTPIIRLDLTPNAGLLHATIEQLPNNGVGRVASLILVHESQMTFNRAGDMSCVDVRRIVGRDGVELGLQRGVSDPPVK